MPGLKTLIFVYNTDSGVLGVIRDFSAHTKSASGSDVCNLSTITHSPVGMKKEWKRFLKDLEIPSQSLGRNEFTSKFGNLQITYPVVLLQKGTALTILIGTDELNRCRDLGDLILLVKGRILDI
jgi:hypothetical protein